MVWTFQFQKAVYFWWLLLLAGFHSLILSSLTTTLVSDFNFLREDWEEFSCSLCGQQDPFFSLPYVSLMWTPRTLSLLCCLHVLVYMENQISLNFSGILNMQNFYCYESEFFASIPRTCLLINTHQKKKETNWKLITQSISQVVVMT